MTNIIENFLTEENISYKKSYNTSSQRYSYDFNLGDYCISIIGMNTNTDRYIINVYDENEDGRNESEVINELHRIIGKNQESQKIRNIGNVDLRALSIFAEKNGLILTMDDNPKNYQLSTTFPWVIHIYDCMALYNIYDNKNNNLIADIAINTSNNKISLKILKSDTCYLKESIDDVIDALIRSNTVLTLDKIHSLRQFIYPSYSIVPEPETILYKSIYFIVHYIACNKKYMQRQIKSISYSNINDTRYIIHKSALKSIEIAILPRTCFVMYEKRSLSVDVDVTELIFSIEPTISCYDDRVWRCKYRSKLVSNRYDDCYNMDFGFLTLEEVLAILTYFTFPQGSRIRDTYITGIICKDEKMKEYFAL